MALIVKSRRAASWVKSSVNSTVAWRPSVALTQGHDPLGRPGRGDVDVELVQARVQERVAHAAADEAGRPALGLKGRQRAPRLERPQPRGGGEARLSPGKHQPWRIRDRPTRMPAVAPQM